MDVNNINPFLAACMNVLPQIGFQEVSKKNISLVKKVSAKGVAVSVGIVGELRGTVVYNFTEKAAKETASKMMMGMEVAEFDEMAQSAISELTNMLTANAAIEFSQSGKNINISTPTLITGSDLAININTKNILAIDLEADGIEIFINIGIENAN